MNSATGLSSLFQDETDSPPDLPAAALALLAQAHDYARRVKHDPWEFAVELLPLCSAGLTHNTLRWLVCEGYVAHAVESTPPGATQRSFTPVSSLSLPTGSCFVLTDKGVRLARQRCKPPAAAPMSDSNPFLSVAVPELSIKPRWDQNLRELWCAGMLVKEFRRPAPNQELVLSAFEEEGWPPHLDDPLPGTCDLDARQRLHDTIIRLNRNQKNRLIVFRGDGSGNGIRWELISLRRTSDAPDTHQIVSGDAAEG